MTAHGTGWDRRPQGPCRVTAVLTSWPGSGLVSTRATAPGRRTERHRRRRASGSPPMPMFPSARRTVPHRPSPGSRSRTSRTRAEPPRSRGSSHRLPGQVHTEGRDPVAGQRLDEPSRTAAHVEDRPFAPRDHDLVGLGQPPPRRRVEQPRAEEPVDRLSSVTRISTDTPARAASKRVVGEHGEPTSRRWSRPNRLPGAAAATSAASAASSTSRWSGSTPTRSPSPRSRASWSAPVLDVDIGMPRIAPGTWHRKPMDQ